MALTAQLDTGSLLDRLRGGEPITREHACELLKTSPAELPRLLAYAKELKERFTPAVVSHKYEMTRSLGASHVGWPRFSITSALVVAPGLMKATESTWIPVPPVTWAQPLPASAANKQNISAKSLVRWFFVFIGFIRLI